MTPNHGMHLTGLAPAYQLIGELPTSSPSGDPWCRRRVWELDYELYAHSAGTRKAGISEEVIRTLATGGLPDDLSDQEKIAQRYARNSTNRLDSRKS
jgi:hypothetical protein